MDEGTQINGELAAYSSHRTISKVLSDAVKRTRYISKSIQEVENNCDVASTLKNSNVGKM